MAKDKSFSSPDTKGKALDKQTDEALYKSSKEIGQTTDASSTRTEGLRDELSAYDKSKLSINHGKNIAKTGGEYGSLNNKDYSSTLRLMRRADAYNNRPQQKALMFNYGGINGPGSLTEIDKERPRLETEEMREMERNRQLDLNQKQLAQSLQDAVNHQDLELFIASYKQRFGIELDREQAELEMRKWARQQQYTDTIKRNWALFERDFGADTAKRLYGLVEEDPYLGGTISAVLMGQNVLPDQLEYTIQQYQNQLLKEARSKGMSTPDAAKYVQTGVTSLITALPQYAQQVIKDNGKYKAARQAKKEVRGILGGLK